jgi:predicted nucleic acid-binding protein
MTRIFLDANLLIDVTDNTRPLHEVSSALFDHLAQNKQTFLLYTSCDLMTTVYYIVRKAIGKKKALEQIKILNRLIHVIEFGNDEIEEAIYLMEKNPAFGDLEDTIQFVMARRARCDYIITNDTRFYSHEVPLLSSGEALERLSGQANQP